jgi:hypothetical protein
MINYEKSTKILECFYEDCVAHWKRQNSKHPELNALQDVLNVKHNPFSPSPEWIDTNAKTDFLDKIIVELML